MTSGHLTKRFLCLLILSCLSIVPWGGALLAAGDKADKDKKKEQPPPVGRMAKAIFPQGIDYRIGVEDLLFVSVWRDPDLTREVPVRPDGKISLPLIQDVLAAGKTPGELADEIRDRLKEYLSNPSVTVVVKEINSLKVYVLGEVLRPGPVTIRSEIRLLQAISMVGGVTAFGGRNGVLIYRNDDNGEKVIEVSYRDLITGKKPDDNVVLEAGDTIVVR
jgi:polysaccharide biosynthesis/export protein